MNNEIIFKLQERLRTHSDPKIKAWWENYVKDSAPFLGIKMADIRTEVRRWHKEFVSDTIAINQQPETALMLIRESYTEEKLAGILFLQEILLPAGAVNCKFHLQKFAELFSGNYIYDWNVCDWFCIKVLGPLIESRGASCADAVSQWRTAENLWQARASVVPFVYLVQTKSYFSEIKKSCGVLIKRDERFAKTAAGWILREISKTDPGFIANLFEDNLKYFSAESLRNAVKYFSKDEKKKYIKILKDLNT